MKGQETPHKNLGRESCEMAFPARRTTVGSAADQAMPPTPATTTTIPTTNLSGLAESLFPLRLGIWQSRVTRRHSRWQHGSGKAAKPRGGASVSGLCSFSATGVVCEKAG